MPNGDDKNWIRVCASIDGFRARHGAWPKRVRVMPIAFVDLASHVLSSLGFALVSSIVEIVPEDDAEMIAEDDSGAEFCYGREGFPDDAPEPTTLAWFGEAILRRDI